MGRGPSIEGRKNAVDAVKAKLFTKLIREIGLSVRAAGADPAGNPRLRLAMSRALDVNMTKDRIEAAIKRASGEGAEAPQEVRYEGYGPGGIAVLVDCVEQRLEHGPNAVPGRAGGGGQDVAGQESVVVHGFQQRGDRSRLVLEVEIERRAGHPGAAGDVGDVDAVESVFTQVMVE